MKRKIALFANGWNGENLDNFIVGLRSTFEEETDLFVFSSYSSYTLDDKNRDGENSIFDLPDYSIFDAAIIYYSGLNSDEKFKEIRQKCDEVGLPVVVQGVEAEGVSTVTVNNYIGMRNLCDHIIEKHGVKKALFIGGPKDNADSNLRLQALKDSLDAHGLTMNDEDVAYANWELIPVKEIIHERYAQKLDLLPDAILCANDPMAYFAVLALETFGAKVPDDIIVSGFDNLSESSTFYPSIASVDQNYYEQGIECGRIANEIIKDASYIENKTINCTAAPGESCGCKNCKDELMKRQKYGHDMMLQKFETANRRGRLTRLETSFLTSVDFKEVPAKIFNNFNRPAGYETSDFHLYLNPPYKNLLYLDADTNNAVIHDYYPVMDILIAKTDGILSTEVTVNSSDLFLGYTGEGKGKTYVFAPMRVVNHVAGYMVMGYNENSFSDIKFFEFTSHMNNTLEKFQDNINFIKLNEKLSILMQKDALTNVKNRTAYDRYIMTLDKEISQGIQKQVAIVMCDINNLKYINDNLSHEAGDEYIKNCCRAMCEIYKHSPVFRVGGDEFIIILTGEDFELRNEHLVSVKQKIADAASNDNPLSRISFAVGMAEYEPSKDTKMANTAKRADALMYLDKAQMKADML